MNEQYKVKYTNKRDTYTHCKTKIDELTQDKKPFYIGATHDPKTRLEEHIKDKTKQMHNMYILCECIHLEKAKNLECRLINKYFKDVKIENDIKVSVGLTHDKNYIYLLK